MKRIPPVRSPSWPALLALFLGCGPAVGQAPSPSAAADGAAATCASEECPRLQRFTGDFAYLFWWIKDGPVPGPLLTYGSLRDPAPRAVTAPAAPATATSMAMSPTVLPRVIRISLCRLSENSMTTIPARPAIRGATQIGCGFPTRESQPNSRSRACSRPVPLAPSASRYSRTLP